MFPTLRLALLVCWAFSSHAAQSQPPSEVWVAGLFPSFRGTGESSTIDKSGVQRQAAFLVALKEINGMEDILPNTTIKFGLGNSRRDSNHVVEETVHLIEAVRLNASKLPVAIIGPASSGPSMMVQRICNGYMLPQIGYSATSPSLSDVATYRYFARLPPSDAYQVTVMANLIKSVVGTDTFVTIAGADLYSTSGIDALERVSTSSAYGMKVLKEYNLIMDSKTGVDIQKLKIILNELKEGQCNVVAAFAQAADYKILFETVAEVGLGETIWVVSETFKPFFSQHRASFSKEVVDVLQNVVFADVESGKNLGRNLSQYSKFESSWSNFGAKGNGEYDMSACSPDVDDLNEYVWRIDHDVIARTSPRCTGFDFGMFPPTTFGSYSPYVYDAVWALSKALHDVLYVHKTYSSSANYPTAEDRVQLFKTLKNISFKGASGPVKFFPSGDRNTDTVTYTVHQVSVSGGAATLLGVGEFRGKTFIQNTDVDSISFGKTVAKCACVICNSNPTVMNTVLADLPAWTIVVLIVFPLLCFAALFHVHNSKQKAIKAKSEAWKIQPEEVQISKTLGRGQYGTVFLGMYGSTKVAVKQFDENSARNVDEFVSELITLVDLRHKHLVQFVGAILETKSLVSDFMERGDLKTILDDESIELSGAKMHDIASQIGLGLEYLHSKGIAHCDMKSENVLVSKNWVVKIADFGLSELVHNKSGSSRGKTRSGSFKGSRSLGRRPSTAEKQFLKAADEVEAARGNTGSKGSLLYLPPEVILGGGYSCQGDIYAYGLVIYEIITRQAPYYDSGHNIFKLQMEIAKNDLRPTWPEFDDPTERTAMKSLRSVAEKCWVKDLAVRISAKKACKTIVQILSLAEASLRTISVRKTQRCLDLADVTDIDLESAGISEEAGSAAKESWHVEQDLFVCSSDFEGLCNGYNVGTILDVGHVFALPLKFRLGKNRAKRKKQADTTREEIVTLAALRHENIVRFHGSSWNPLQQSQCCVFYMVPGGDSMPLDLERFVKIDRALDPQALLAVSIQVCTALKYLHDNSIIHGFLNHRTVLITPSAVVKLTRFEGNILKSNKARNEIDEEMHMGWDPPEVLILSQYSEASDVFSVGVLLWFLLTKRVPFQGDKYGEVNRRIVNDSARPLLTMKDMDSFKFYCPQSKMSFVDLIQSAWEQKIDDRIKLEKIHEILKSWKATVKKGDSSGMENLEIEAGV